MKQGGVSKKFGLEVFDKASAFDITKVYHTVNMHHTCEINQDIFHFMSNT